MLLTALGCGSKPLLVLSPGDCSPVIQLQQNGAYAVIDLSTGKRNNRFATLFVREVERGCLVPRWDARKKDDTRKFSTAVEIFKDGKLKNVQEGTSTEAPLIKIPTGDDLKGLHFVLYFIASTQLGEHKEVCERMQRPDYECFDNQRECAFYVRMYPDGDSGNKLPLGTRKGCELCAPEVCDGQDNDCDGQTDNVFGSANAMKSQCYMGPQEKYGIGKCRAVEVSCNQGRLECASQTAPGQETCNNVDDDCNGKVDDGELCKEGLICKNGECVIPPCRLGEASCGDTCVNLQEDPKHCGACGTACNAGELCSRGACVTSCPRETPQVCGKSCVNLQNNRNHCGGCDKACFQGELCASGRCVLDCPSSAPKCGATGQETCCSLDCCNNACVDSSSNPQHCGACGRRCNPGELCFESKCIVSCPAKAPKCGAPGAEYCCPNACCGQQCIDTLRDRRHCGGCGKACAEGEICYDGVCVLSCPKEAPKCGAAESGTCCSLSCCGDACVDIKKDRAHCGACGKPCRPGEICDDGRCSLSCPTTAPACGIGNQRTCCAFGCCSDTCVDTKNNPKHCGGCGKSCYPGQFCDNGVCKFQCPPNQQLCNNKCIDTTINPQNCGGCGKTCRAGERCENGKCLLCPASAPACGTAGQETCCSLDCCSNTCVDVKNDPLHCGGCGKSCAAGERCLNGQCRLCPASLPKCGQACCTNCCNNTCVDITFNPRHCGGCNRACATGTCCSSRCVDFTSDDTNCGGCGKICPTGERCSFGNCCTSGLTWCGTRCVDTQKDNSHCGTCGNPCFAGKFCQNGTCICPTGRQDCNGVCVQLDADDRNCGRCGNACTGGQTCQSGICACPSGQTNCSGTCVDLQKDAAHCGACGRACGSGKVCNAGICECPTGTTDCGGVCADTQTNAQHCGGCNQPCTGGKVCTTGACACPSGQIDCSGTCTTGTSCPEPNTETPPEPSDAGPPGD